MSKFSSFLKFVNFLTVIFRNNKGIQDNEGSNFVTSISEKRSLSVPLRTEREMSKRTELCKNINSVSSFAEGTTQACSFSPSLDKGICIWKFYQEAVKENNLPTSKDCSIDICKGGEEIKLATETTNLNQNVENRGFHPRESSNQGKKMLLKRHFCASKCYLRINCLVFYPLPTKDVAF